MSKAALDALIKSIRDYEEFKKTIKIEEDERLGILGRKAGLKSTQVFKLDKNELKQQLSKMLKSEQGLDLKDLKDSSLNSIVDTVYKNIEKYITDRNYEYSEEEKGWLVEGGEDNYQQVVNALSGAFGDKNTTTPFFDFVIEELEKSSAEENEKEIELVKLATVRADKDAKWARRFRLDAGHVIANIKDIFQIICFNSIRSSAARSRVFTKKTGEELEKLRKEWLKLLENEQSAKALFDTLVHHKVIVAEKNYKDVISEFFNMTITFSRDISTGKIHGHIKNEKKIRSLSEFNKLTKQIPKYLMPEWAWTNQAEKAQVEQSVMRHLNIAAERSNTKLIAFLNRWVSGEKFPGLPDISNFPGSPTLLKMASDGQYEALTTGKITPKHYASTSTKKGSAKVSSTGKKNIFNVQKAPPVKLQKKPVPPVPKTIGKTKQTALNLINVVNLINYKLGDTIRENMGSPRLNWRTGRFAQSAKVLPATMDKDGVLRLPYTYMKNPYQTFEPGFAQGSRARDPKSLISESIREIASKIVLMKMRVVRV